MAFPVHLDGALRVSGGREEMMALLGGETGDLDGGVAVVGEGEGFVTPVAAALAAEEEGGGR